MKRKPGLLAKAASWLLGAGNRKIGERLINRVLLSSGLSYAWPGSWTADRLEMVRHFRHWIFVAIHVRMDSAATHKWHLDYVCEGPDRLHGEKNFVWRKSLNAIQAHEEVEPAEHDHPLRTLLQNPNSIDTEFDFWSELCLFLLLTGNGYIWVIPNRFGIPCELWVIPSHWVWTVPGKESWIKEYQLRPWTGYAGAPVVKIKPEHMIHIKCKSPISKIDGYAATTALGQWTDIYESANNVQWSSFKNQGLPGLHAELGPEYVDPTDQELDRIYEKFFTRFQSEFRAGLPIITPPGMKLSGLTVSPTEMGFRESADQMRDNILAGFGVGKTIVGLNEAQQATSVLGALYAFGAFTQNPYFAMVAQAVTKGLCHRYPNKGTKRLRFWYPDSTPVDPQQLNQDMDLDARLGLLTYDEGRAMRGRPPWKFGGDQPITSPPVGHFGNEQPQHDQDVEAVIAGPGEGVEKPDLAVPSLGKRNRFAFGTNGNGHGGGGGYAGVTED